MNSDASQSPDAEETDEVKEVAATGKSSLFVLLTCGFLACLCCVGGLFVGGSVAWVRTANLGEALDKVGTPQSWRTTDSTVTPWSAEASLRGPSSPGEIEEWLTQLGVEVVDVEVDKCLGTDSGCTLTDVTVGGFPAEIHYVSVNETEATATVVLT